MIYLYMFFALVCFSTYAMEESNESDSSVEHSGDIEQVRGFYKHSNLLVDKGEWQRGFVGSDRVLVEKDFTSSPGIGIRAVDFDRGCLVPVGSDLSCPRKSFGAVKVSPDGSRCLIVDDADGASIVAADSMKIISTIDLAKLLDSDSDLFFQNQTMAIAEHLCIVATGKQIWLVDSRTGSVVKSFTSKTYLSALAAFYAGNQLRSASKGTLTTWDIGKGLPIKTIVHEVEGRRIEPDRIEVDQASGTMFVNARRSITCIQQGTSEDISHTDGDGPPRFISAIALSADGSHLAIGSWRAKTGPKGLLWDVRRDRYARLEAIGEETSGSFSSALVNATGALALFQYTSRGRHRASALREIP